VALTNANRFLVDSVAGMLSKLGYLPSTIRYVESGEQHADRFGRCYTTRLDGFRVSLQGKDDVERFLDWLGPIPHPTKETERVWAWRLLKRADGAPVRWVAAERVKSWLDGCAVRSVELGRRRATRFYIRTQEEMNSGMRSDRRPRRAQTVS
ncbi:MAG: hypothetical protein RMJ30_07850, partial [Nitrososphaerota archaeon]|nr:hypothetical protein [Nitrososphaerota archaeon]